MLIVLSPYKFTEYHFKYYELDVFEKKLKKNLKYTIYQKLLIQKSNIYLN